MPDYTTYKAEDLLMDESFVDYLQGKQSGRCKILEDLLTAHPQMSGEWTVPKNCIKLIKC